MSITSETQGTSARRSTISPRSAILRHRATQRAFPRQRPSSVTNSRTYLTVIWSSEPMLSPLRSLPITSSRSWPAMWSTLPLPRPLRKLHRARQSKRPDPNVMGDGRCDQGHHCANLPSEDDGDLWRAMKRIPGHEPAGAASGLFQVRSPLHGTEPHRLRLRGRCLRSH